jgi:hypothetical protein
MKTTFFVVIFGCFSCAPPQEPFTTDLDGGVDSESESVEWSVDTGTEEVVVDIDIRESDPVDSDTDTEIPISADRCEVNGLQRCSEIGNVQMCANLYWVDWTGCDNGCHLESGVAKCVKESEEKVSDTESDPSSPPATDGQVVDTDTGDDFDPSSSDSDFVQEIETEEDSESVEEETLESDTEEEIVVMDSDVEIESVEEEIDTEVDPPTPATDEQDTEVDTGSENELIDQPSSDSDFGDNSDSDPPSPPATDGQDTDTAPDYICPVGAYSKKCSDDGEVVETCSVETWYVTEDCYIKNQGCFIVNGVAGCYKATNETCGTPYAERCDNDVAEQCVGGKWIIMDDCPANTNEDLCAVDAGEALCYSDAPVEGLECDPTVPIIVASPYEKDANYGCWPGSMCGVDSHTCNVITATTTARPSCEDEGYFSPQPFTLKAWADGKVLCQGSTDIKPKNIGCCQISDPADLDSQCLGEAGNLRLY